LIRGDEKHVGHYFCRRNRAVFCASRFLRPRMRASEEGMNYEYR
jgi:hypothetical protein